MGVISTKNLRLAHKHQIILFTPGANSFKKIISLGIPKCSIFPEGVEVTSLPDSPAVKGVPLEICSVVKDGDVVLIDPSGKVSLVYAIASNDNAIFVTNRCNCSCIMCPQPPGKDPENVFEQNLLLMSLMKDKRGGHLGITGGEPTILGSELVEIITRCGKHLPNTALTLLTNGRKLKDFEFTRELASSGWPNLRFEIPLYADNDAEHDSIMGAAGSFYDSIEGLHNLALLGQSVGLRTVLHALTIERLVEYSEFVYRNLPFVLHVAFMGMETTGKARDNIEKLWVDPYDYSDLLLAAVIHLHRRNIPVSIYNHQLCTLPRDLWLFARRSISTWKETYLPFCDECYVKKFCCGIFGTGDKNSAHIKPIYEKEVPVPWRYLGSASERPSKLRIRRC